MIIKVYFWKAADRHLDVLRLCNISKLPQCNRIKFANIGGGGQVIVWLTLHPHHCNDILKSEGGGPVPPPSQFHWFCMISSIYQGGPLRGNLAFNFCYL